MVASERFSFVPVSSRAKRRSIATRRGRLRTRVRFPPPLLLRPRGRGRDHTETTPGPHSPTPTALANAWFSETGIVPRLLRFLAGKRRSLTDVACAHPDSRSGARRVAVRLETTTPGRGVDRERTASGIPSPVPFFPPHRAWAVNEQVCRRCGRETWSPRSPYCREHRPPPEVRAKWAAKTREARGYGLVHKRLRERYRLLVYGGSVVLAPVAAGESFRASPLTSGTSTATRAATPVSSPGAATGSRERSRALRSRTPALSGARRSGETPPDAGDRPCKSGGNHRWTPWLVAPTGFGRAGYRFADLNVLQ